MIAAVEKPVTQKSSSKSPAPPPLENGDRLTAREFLRRYDAMPHVKKAELIEGIVYIMSSPVRADAHAVPDAIAIGWLGNYAMLTPGVEVMSNGTVKLDADNVPQPDASLRILENAGGQSKMVDGYVQDSPELLIEIAASSASIDLHQKMQAYRRNGAREYLVWRTLDAGFDWFVLKEEVFQRVEAGADGLIRSEVFPGLWLDVAALLKRDRAGIWAALQKGLAAPEHAEFVAGLKSKSMVKA